MAKANFTYQRVGDAKIDLAMQQVSQAFARVDQADVMIVAEINQAMYSAAGNESLIVANRTCKITLPTPTGLWSVTIVQGSKANSVTVTTASATVALDGSTPGSVTLSEVATSVQIVTDGTAYYVVASPAQEPTPPSPPPPGPPFGPPVGPPGPPSIPTGPAGGDLTGTYPNPLVAPNKVTYAKMQQVGAGALLGNPTGSAADVSEITLGNGLQFFFPAPGVQQLENSSALFMLTVSPPLSFDGISVLASLFDNVSLTLNGGNALQRAALSGDVTAAAGSNSVAVTGIHDGTSVDFQTSGAWGAGQFLRVDVGGSHLIAAGTISGDGTSITTSNTGIPPENLTISRAALTGDVTAPAGSSATTLASVGTAGSYIFVTTDAKGRVTAGNAPPAANEILFSTGTGSAPAGDATFTWDGANKSIVLTSLDSGLTDAYPTAVSTTGLISRVPVRTLSIPFHVTFVPNTFGSAIKWLMTTSDSATSGSQVSYTGGSVYKYWRLTVATDQFGVTTGGYGFDVTMNGSSIGSVAVSAVGVHQNSGTTGSTLTTDSYGVRLNSTAAGATTNLNSPVLELSTYQFP